MQPLAWSERNPNFDKAIEVLPDSCSSKYSSPFRRECNATRPKSTRSSLKMPIRSSLLLDNPCFFSYRLKTHRTISVYNSVLLVGKTPSKSSQRTQSKVTFKGFLDKFLNSSEYRIFCSKFSCKSSLLMFLKYVRIKLFASSSVKPTISHRVSQYLLSFLPTS